MAFVVNRLATRLSRITNTHFTVGTGSSQPFGIVTRAASGRSAPPADNDVIYDDLVDLEHSVDPAYRRNAAYMMNDASVKTIRRIRTRRAVHLRARLRRLAPWLTVALRTP